MGCGLNCCVYWFVVCLVKMGSCFCVILSLWSFIWSLVVVSRLVINLVNFWILELIDGIVLRWVVMVSSFWYLFVIIWLLKWIMCGNIVFIVCLWVVLKLVVNGFVNVCEVFNIEFLIVNLVKFVFNCIFVWVLRFVGFFKIWWKFVVIKC